MFSLELNILIASLVSLFVTFIIVPKFIMLANKLRLFDLPGEREEYVRKIPISGGVAILIGIMFSLLFFAEIGNIQYIIISLLIVFFVGLIDDLLGLSPFKKILGQLIAILILIYLQDLKIDNMHGVLGIYELPHIISTLFTVFVVIVIINAFNLIDGVDGLAAGIGIISSLFFGVIGLLMNQEEIALLAFSLFGALIGFLRYNFFPAKIFMGDTGSLVVGMGLAILALNIISSGIIVPGMHYPNKGPLLAIVFLALPLFDSLRVFINRLIKKKHPLMPDRDHIHHAILDLGYGHKKTTLILYFFSLLLIFGSYFLLDVNLNIAITILAFISYVLLFIPFLVKNNG